MNIIFEKDMAPEVLAAWYYYKELYKNLSTFMGNSDELDCHAFLFDCEYDLNLVVHNCLHFFRGVVAAYDSYNLSYVKVSSLSNMTAYVFFYESHLKGYCVWFADEAVGPHGIIEAIRQSCAKSQLDSFNEFMKREAKRLMTVTPQVI